MNDLWRLIEIESQSVGTCCEFLERNSASDDMSPVIDTVKRIVGDKRDNVKALMTLYDSLTKDKPATNTTEFARKAIADYRESTKLIK